MENLVIGVIGAAIGGFLFRMAGVSTFGLVGSLVSATVGSIVLLYGQLRGQAWLPLNPGGLPGMPPDLAFNTAISFATNTNWQNYGGESTLSYLSQMLGLTHQNFLSAATGIVLAVALIRGFARASMSTIGNFWVDITRCTLYVLLPLCVIFTLFLVWQGIPQTLGAYVDVTTLEGGKQSIALGPVASQVVGFAGVDMGPTDILPLTHEA